MCGIAGIINTDKSSISPILLEKMTHSLAHRGPDGFGTEIAGSIGFGHRRLSIIDPAGGRQPMFNEDGRVWVTFNGEIYNYRELRAELQSRGHRFASNSDTETIVHAYEEWGEQCVERFRGMFAFAIADHRKGKIFLARDHFGMKPLYYLQGKNVFAFASEIQALRQIPDIGWNIDLTAMDQYLWLQYIPAPRTAFKEICKLPPAHRMTITFDGRTDGPQQYWELQFRPNYNRSEQDWIDVVDETLSDSVRAHLVSDVPFGAFLSGGVDSSLVVGYMTRLLNRSVDVFSIGFEEPEFNETPFARFAADRCGATQHIEIVKPDALAILPDLVRCYGDLFGDSSAIPTYYLSQVARRNVPMVLSGDGADELFAGYWSHGDWLNSLQKDPSTRPTLAHWLSFINYADSGRRLSLWRDEYKDVCPAPQETFEKAFAVARPFSLCHKAQFFDIKTYLPYDILTKVDIASMMHGLEVRPPFVDLRVAELAASIPEHLSIGKNLRGEWERKLLLKKVGEKYYPREFLNRPKMGFAIPLLKWFAPTGHLHDTLRQRLTGSDSTLLEFFNPDAMQELIAANATGPLWLLLFAEEWLRQNRGTPETVALSRTPEIRTEPLRVRILYDVAGWAWWHRSHRIMESMSPLIRVDIAQMDEPFEHEPYDFVMVFDPYLIDRIADVPPRKRIIGCSCPKFLPQAEALLKSRRCLSVVVNSREMFNRSTVKDSLFCCQNGVDLELFHPAPEHRNKLVGCWVGNSDSAGNKGLDTIRTACRNAGAELLVLDKNAANGTEGLMTQAEVRDKLYHQSTFYICASEWEGTPNPALEALACGLPVVSTRVGNMPELIVDGYNGYLVDRTAESIADAIDKLGKGDLAEMSRNARSSIENGWNWSAQAAKYEKMFLTLREKVQTKNRAIFTNEMGEELFGRGDVNGAITLFGRAVEIDPECAEALNNLGVILSQHGRTADALNYMSKAVRMAPENGTFIINIAEVLRAAGREDDALGVCLDFLNSQPENRSVRTHLDTFAVK